MKNRILAEAVRCALGGPNRAQPHTTGDTRKLQRARLAGPNWVMYTAPMRLFRYLKQEFADALLTKGAIRIGTLYDFRRLEHARGVSDPTEGTKQSQYPLHDVVINQPENHEFFKGTTLKARSIHISGPAVTFQRNIESEDLFVLCLSSECSQAVMSEFDNVDTCLEISNINAFFMELTSILTTTTPVRFAGIQECVYAPRVEQWNERNFGIHPALMKEPHFSKQKEVRAIWHSLSPGPIHPVVIKSHKLIDLCSRRLGMPGG